MYGGGFRSGGSGCTIYDGYSMADKGVVFVSINYRVGVFGFLAHADLTAESGYHASGNYALLDMIVALKWVKKNIKSFGGDPDRVTIAGQSAGAFGVNYLTASPLTKGLIHRAIAESGGNFYTNPTRPALDLKGAESMGVKFAETMHCKDINELRAKSADEILAAQSGLSGPVMDGYVLPSSIFDVYSKGKQNDIPIIVGWNENDKLFWKPKDATVFKEEMQKKFGTKAEDFFKAYPSNTQVESDLSQNNYSRDETYGIQDYTWAKMQTKTGKAKAYIYNFNRKLPSYTDETQYGAFHSGEIVYAYDNLKTVDRPWEPIDQTIAAQMSSYWVNFTKTGNPNGPGLPLWQVYNQKTEPILIIDKVIESKPLPSKMQMTFWEAYFRK
ncbi:MAG: carboxylesterase family protein [Saprospiraceae bacterium]